MSVLHLAGLLLPATSERWSVLDIFACGVGRGLLHCAEISSSRESTITCTRSRCPGRLPSRSDLSPCSDPPRSGRTTPARCPGQASPSPSADLEKLRARCAELDLPLSLEWVVETCPSLGPAAAEAGLEVHEYRCSCSSEPTSSRRRPRCAARSCPPLPTYSGKPGLSPTWPSVSLVQRSVRAGPPRVTPRSRRPRMRRPLPFSSGPRLRFLVTAGVYSDHGIVAQRRPPASRRRPPRSSA